MENKSSVSKPVPLSRVLEILAKNLSIGEYCPISARALRGVLHHNITALQRRRFLAKSEGKHFFREAGRRIDHTDRNSSNKRWNRNAVNYPKNFAAIKHCLIILR